jgi:hypothetical protein
MGPGGGEKWHGCCNIRLSTARKKHLSKITLKNNPYKITQAIAKASIPAIIRSDASDRLLHKP